VKLNVTGNWRGVFSYPDAVTPIDFDAQLHESDGAISGVVHEMDDDGRGLMHFTALIEGKRQTRDIDFRKTYDDMEPICIVDYVGKLDPDGLLIAGEWVRLDNLMSGSFAMQRQSKQAQAIERELETEAPLNR
jgi:hypothetical protein